MTFKNVDVKKTANIYDGGRVSSRTITTADGKMKTLGVMLPGTYHFNTDAPERIDVQQGRCRVKRAGESAWSEYRSGDSFDVPGRSSFDIDVTELLDYICHFGG